MSEKFKIKENEQKGLSSLWVYAQASLYLIGFIIIFAINSLFNDINANFSQRIHNEQSRLSIGELIVLDLKQIESAFYQMATTSNIKGQAYVRKELQKSVNDLRDLLLVLNNGGTVKRDTHLNIDSHDIMSRIIDYERVEDEDKYILEIIDLKPKLEQIEQESDKLLSLLNSREKLRLSGDQKAYIESLDTIKTYLITLPQLFVRAMENANRLFFQSQQNLKKLETHIQQEREYYSTLQLILSIVIVIAILLLSFATLRQVERSKARLQGLAKNLEFQKFALDQHAIVSATDTKGRIIYANQKFCDITGYSEDELLGQNHNILKSNEHDAMFFKELWTTVLKGEVWSGEIKNTSKDHKHSWFAATIVPLLDEDGNPFQFFAIRTNITERKQMETTIKEKNRFLQGLTNTMGEGVYAVDKGGLCTFINPKGLELIGYHEDEVLGHSIHQLIHHHNNRGENLDPDGCSILQNIIAHNNYRSDQEYFFNKKQQMFPVSVNAAPIYRDGKIDGHVTVFQDISKRKEQELALQNAKEQAEEANLAKSSFLANMSHEIRTPMNAIIGMSYLILETKLNSKQHNYASKINHSAELLLGIINDILDLSKVEAGKMMLEKSEFSLQEVFTNLADLFTFKAEEKGLQFVFDIDANIPNRLIGDSLRLNQILVNLCNNALKFTEKGEINVSVTMNNSTVDSVNLKFAVQDTGIGISQEQQKNLFTPFNQADVSTTRKYGGTGLGLSICQKLVALKGGEIWIDSEKGKGSTFYFTTPLKVATSQSHKDIHTLDNNIDPQAKEKLIGAQLLVVEDNTFNQEVFSDLLTAKDISVTIAENGREALNILENKDFDGILMDCQMPIMDGYEATQKIRQIQRLKSIPIIALTANVMPEEISKMLACGMNAHIAKPVNVELMFKTLNRWIAPIQADINYEEVVDIKTLPSQTDTLQIKKAIKRLSTTQQGYLKLIANFLESEKNLINDLNLHFKEKNQEYVLRKLHTLKGTAGTIGAEPLQRLAMHAENELKTDYNSFESLPFASELHIAIEAVFKEIQYLLDRYQTPSNKQAMNKMSSDTLNSLFASLLETLNDFDSDSEKYIHELLQTQLSDGVKHKLELAAKSIYKYEYEDALQHLKGLNILG